MTHSELRFTVQFKGAMKFEHHQLNVSETPPKLKVPPLVVNISVADNGIPQIKPGLLQQGINFTEKYVIYLIF